MTVTHHGGRHRPHRLRKPLGRRLTAASVIGAAGTAGWLLTATGADSQPAPAPAQPVAAPSHEQIQRAGQVIAATGDSLTTSTPDGETTTFRITSQTAQIGAPGMPVSGPHNAFPLKRNVVVHGVIHDGVAVATAIADQAAVGPDGPPMDYALPT